MKVTAFFAFAAALNRLQVEDVAELLIVPHFRGKVEAAVTLAGFDPLVAADPCLDKIMAAVGSSDPLHGQILAVFREFEAYKAFSGHGTPMVA
jgi:hypothetical protein